ncbi:MAG: hypothetical protein AAF242_20925, partial [Bacteroidota bacterium]
TQAEQIKVTAARDHTVRLWDNTGQNVGEMLGHQGNIYQVLYLQKSKQYVTRSSDGSIRLWAAAGAPIRTLAQRAYFYELRTDPQQNFLIATTADHEVLVWSTDQLEKDPIILENAAAITKLELLNDEGDLQLFTQNIYKELRIQTIRNGQVQAVPPMTKVAGFLLIPNPAPLITWDKMGNIKIYTTDGQVQNKWLAHDEAILGIDYNPTNQTLLSTGLDLTVKWWTLDGRQLLHWPITQIQEQQPIAQFSNDQQSFLIPNFYQETISSHRVPELGIAENQSRTVDYPADLKRRYAGYFE